MNGFKDIRIPVCSPAASFRIYYPVMLRPDLIPFKACRIFAVIHILRFEPAAESTRQDKQT
jgi:hypothetical protein